MSHKANDADVSRSKPTIDVIQQLVLYEEAKATGDDWGPDLLKESTLDGPLAIDLACVDLMHRVWADVNPPVSGISDSPPPKVLGDFRLIRELGRGGMGTVFEADQISMGRRVALKVLPFAALVHEKSLQRFRNEVRAAAALDHPHIVSVYFVGEDRGVHFFAMQFIRGQTLADAIAQMRTAEQAKSQPNDSLTRHMLLTIEGRHAGSHGKGNSDVTGSPPSTTTWKERSRTSTSSGSGRIADFYRAAARLGIQAASALQHAHDLGVLHRDIKPSNLMLDAEGQMYITDFGLARIEADAGVTMTGDIVGTLRYMAPEQALAQRVVIDHRADIYSLGATLYELLTLQPAFPESDRSELLKQIAFVEPCPLRKLDRRIPVELETIIHKAMSKSRQERYQTAGQLADDLGAFLEDRPIKARPPSYADRVRKWSRRHQTLVGTVGIALVAITLLQTISMAVIRRAQTRTVAALENTSNLLYAADMALAYQIFDKGWSDEVQLILDRQQPTERETDRRGVEWHLLQQQVKQPTSTTLAGHKGSVNEVAVFPDGRRLASVGHDGTLRIWDVFARRLIHSIPICDQELYSVAISPDGRFVAVGNIDLYLCDLDQAGQPTKCFRSTTNIESLAFSSDSKRLAVGARYEEVLLLSLTGEIEKRIPCASRVESLEFVAGSNLLLVPNRRPTSDRQELGFVELWSEDLAAVKQELDGSRMGRPGQITIARQSPGGRFVAAGAQRNSKAYFFDRSSGRLLAETPVSRDRLNDLAYSPDAKAVAIGYRNGRIEYFKLQPDADGNPLINRRPLVVNAHQGEVTSLRFVDANTLATCGTDGLIRIWDLTNDIEQAFDLTNSRMNGLQLSPDGARLLYVNKDELIIANMKSGDVEFHLNTPDALYNCPIWSTTGDTMAVCCGQKSSVDIFDRSGKAICSIATKGRPEAIAFSPNGSLIAIVGAQQLQVCRSDNGKQVLWQRLSQPGSTVAFSHDGSRLAFGRQYGPVVLLDIASQKPLLELVCASAPTCLAFNRDDSTLAAGYGDSNIRLWEVPTGRLRAELVGHEQAVNNVVFAPDGHTLLSAADDGAIRLWSVDYGRAYGVIHQRFEAGTRDAKCLLSLSFDGQHLAFGHKTEQKDCPDVNLWPIKASAIK